MLSSVFLKIKWFNTILLSVPGLQFISVVSFGIERKKFILQSILTTQTWKVVKIGLPKNLNRTTIHFLSREKYGRRKTLLISL